LDFGVSKWMESADATLTAAELVGTPQYMAPEQARGERDLDQCADLYALSAIAYRALTGEAPFGGQLPAILRTIAEQMPRAPSVVAELPREVDYVLAIGLAKVRSDRFQSAAELASALAQAASGKLDPTLVKRAKTLLSALPYAK
jgi:serine/threonine-protein kinase